MTCYRKRDHLQFYFVNIVFLVWIVSATSVEYNGASWSSNITQRTCYGCFKLIGSPVAKDKNKQASSFISCLFLVCYVHVRDVQ